MPLSINDEIPKSRITLTYRTTAGGEREDVNLPFRLLIMGDLSNGSSKDRREAELDKRTIRNLDGRNLDAMMKDMDMSMEFDVENRVDPDGGDVHVKLKVDSMKSLGPAEIAQQIPKVKSLLLLRKLLMEVQANLDNHKEFRKLIRTLAQTKTSEDLRTELARLGDFKDFQVPELQPKAAPSEDGAEG